LGGITRRAQRLTINEALARLAECDFVDGIAVCWPNGGSVGEFCLDYLGPAEIGAGGVHGGHADGIGFRVASGDATVNFNASQEEATEPGSDYDILVLASELPHGVAHVFTELSGRMADIVILENSACDRFLEGRLLPSGATLEGVFILKLRRAEILKDRSGRLERARLAVRAAGGLFRRASPSFQYVTWFAENFRLARLRRMMRSKDPIYLAALDMMLAAAPSAACRAYFDIRSLPWEGEKAAIRVLQVQDPDCLKLLMDCVAPTGREERLGRYERLAAYVLRPFGQLWSEGETAVSFAVPIRGSGAVEAALDFWEGLLGQSPS